MVSVPHSQYHACWYSGDLRSQSISRDGIELQSRNIPSPTSEELTLEVPRYLAKSRRPCWVKSCDPHRWYRIFEYKKNLKERMSNLALWWWKCANPIHKQTLSGLILKKNFVKHGRFWNLERTRALTPQLFVKYILGYTNSKYRLCKYWSSKKEYRLRFWNMTVLRT